MHCRALGMPRRVYTYPAEMGWQILNLISTTGAFLLAAGVLVFLYDLARNLRLTLPSRPATSGARARSNGCTTMFTDRAAFRGCGAANRCGTTASGRRCRQGALLSAGAPTGGRETIITSAIEANPQYVLRLPGPGWTPFLRGRVHGGILHAADRQSSSSLALVVRRAGGGLILRVGVGQRPRAAGPRRHRRRHPAADLRLRVRHRTPGGRW